MNTLNLGRVLIGRERGANKRVAGISAGVAVGVALLLLICAAYTALGDRAERSTWAGQAIFTADAELPTHISDEQVLVAVSGPRGGPPDYYRGESITRVNIAATADSRVVVPGIGTPPGPGEYFASPALAALIDAVPADELGDRYGERLGLIGDEGLLGPDTLLAVVGDDLSSVSDMFGAALQEDLTGVRYPNLNYQIIAIVGGIAVLFPVAILIAIVTKLGQAARTERFSTLRLIGARPRLVARLAALESMLPACIGGLVGVGLFFALRPVAAQLSIESSRFFVADLTVPWVVILLIVVGVVLLTGIVAFVTAFRAGLGPLGGSREQREQTPRWTTLIPLLLGLVVLLLPVSFHAFGAMFPRTDLAVPLGFVLVIVGIVTSGPYLTWRVSRMGIARAKQAAGVLAMSRIARHPRATFRSVSGLVLAVFVVTVFAVGATTEEYVGVADAPTSELVHSDAAVLLNLDQAQVTTVEQARDVLEPLAHTSGVDRVVIASWIDEDGDRGSGYTLESDDARALGLEAVSGAHTWVDGAYFGVVSTGAPAKTAEVSGEIAETAPPSLAVVLTDGSTGANDRVRTAAMKHEVPLIFAPYTRTDQSGARATSWAAQYASLAWVGVLIATLISAVSLGVAAVAGMLDRKRVLGLLRLSGMPVATLRKMIAVETALPLATVFFSTIALGFLTAWAIVVGLSAGGRNVVMPGLSYLGLLGVCLLLAAAAILVVFRSVRSDLPLTTTRFE